jgi:hypothetical protein
MDWTIVEVAVGLSFLFFLLSVVASAVNEAIAGIFKLRAKTLEKGITNLLTGSTRPTDGGLKIVGDLYRHTLVNGYGKDKDKPSYLSSRSFRNALFEVTGLLEATVKPTDDPQNADAIRREVEAKIGAIQIPILQDSLTTIWHSVNRDATEFRAGVERWFDRGMERVSGWYKRRAQVIVFIAGLAVTVLINASALTAANRLWKDDGFRNGLVAQVEHQQEAASGTEALDRLEELPFPIGWEESNQPRGWGWALAILGWLITGFAVSFGAPFWFDVLNKISNLRAAGVKPDSVLTPAPSKSEVSTVNLNVETGQPPT